MNYSSWAKSSPPSTLVNKVSLEHGLAHLCRFSCFNGRLEQPEIFTDWIFRESFPSPDADHSSCPRHDGGGGIWGGSPRKAIPEVRQEGHRGVNQTRLRSQGRPRQKDTLCPDGEIRESTVSPRTAGVYGSAKTARPEKYTVATL